MVHDHPAGTPCPNAEQDDCGDNGTGPEIRQLGKHRRDEIPGVLQYSRAVPLSMIKPPLFTPDEAIELLVAAVAEMGRLLHETRVGLPGERLALRHCDRLGWQPDGTPYIRY